VSLWRDPDDVQYYEILPSDKADGGLSRLHSADEDAVSWLTNMVHDMHSIREEEEVKKCSTCAPVYGGRAGVVIPHECLSVCVCLQDNTRIQ